MNCNNFLLLKIKFTKVLIWPYSVDEVTKQNKWLSLSYTWIIKKYQLHFHWMTSLGSPGMTTEWKTLGGTLRNRMHHLCASMWNSPFWRSATSRLLDTSPGLGLLESWWVYPGYITGKGCLYSPGPSCISLEGNWPTNTLTQDILAFCNLNPYQLD